MFNRLLFAIILLIVTQSALAEYCPVYAVIVVIADNGEVIYSHNADSRTQPASLAKMMTLLLVFKALQRKELSPLTKISISAYAARQKPSILGLKCGEFISARDAIQALIVKSANDIAVAMAEHLGKTEKAFVAMMNTEAQRLGMTSTKFFNASGWKDPRQVTTARDMAKLANALLKEYPGYYHFFAKKQFLFDKKTIKGHYALLGKRGSIVVDGIKTGFVNASGYNVVASAVKDNTRLIAVVLGGRSSKKRDALADLLFKKGFSKLLNRKIINSAKQNAIEPPMERTKAALAERKAAKIPSSNAGIYNKIIGLS